MFSNLVNRSCYGCDHIILYFANIKINSSKDFNHHKFMLVRLVMCMYVCILQNYFVSRKLSYLWYAAGGRIQSWKHTLKIKSFFKTYVHLHSTKSWSLINCIKSVLWKISNVCIVEITGLASIINMIFAWILLWPSACAFTKYHLLLPQTNDNVTLLFRILNWKKWKVYICKGFCLIYKSFSSLEQI